MSLTSILVLIGTSLGIHILCLFSAARRLRNPLLLVASVIVIYWLQPALPIRGLDFWLPTTTILIAVLGWVLTSRVEEREPVKLRVTAVILAVTILAIALTRYVGSTGILTASRPPQTHSVALVLFISAGVFFALSRFKKPVNALLSTAIIGLVLIFLVLKMPQLTGLASSTLRGLTGQSRELASAFDIRWLGFSYIAFRLIHTLRDRQTGHLPAMSLEEYLVYMLFFPAFNAGPIDRAERFIKWLRQPLAPEPHHLEQGGKRLVLGLFKKFVLADTLAIIALNGTSALQAQGSSWAWLMLYAYGFQIFFDFSGYTDIAIGLGELVGIRLPENFNRPYLKTSLTRFWDNWHITLTQWFRAYFFNPLTRGLRTKARWMPAWLVILVTQLTTMVLIGLWHGVTWNFLLWGAWHGLGLFINNRWSSETRGLAARVQERPFYKGLMNAVSILLTFHYVTLGWVWFALPDVMTSTRVFAGLFGLAVLP
jgi:D-alanyl-lipoteichoic acid acyltransferase DltB (MBOAT superfamily)